MKKENTLIVKIAFILMMLMLLILLLVVGVVIHQGAMMIGIG
jgi:hypothetical protein|nr:MAG TPA: hypothetical protein [Crassvirales sp.]